MTDMTDMIDMSDMTDMTVAGTLSVLRPAAKPIVGLPYRARVVADRRVPPLLPSVVQCAQSSNAPD